ncbi:hypothetical protein [Halobaculum lipolyticum]|uniref:MYXO-CTERM domain-containing protein n=1 Tax=Halobaculum lipolyticum TaxID=3032001 RepID=A0ABD5W8R7_9EURY|nr:hypothetical protein [Halobaculum sp. DT31]
MSKTGADDRTRRYARRLARFAALTLVVHAVLAALVYRDARDRDVSGARWAALTLVGGLLGVAGYRRRR